MRIVQVTMAALAALVLASAAAAQQDSTQAPASSPQAPSSSSVAVTSLIFCTAVENREPVGESNTFAEDVGTVCCITRITGVEGESTVTHVWYEGDTEISRVELPVRAASWRTWSCKTIAESSTWRVDVEDANGTVLQSGTFTIGAASGQ